jgi:hypothetical protein
MATRRGWKRVAAIVAVFRLEMLKLGWELQELGMMRVDQPKIGSLALIQG